jgi:hypothetical protein
MQKRELAYAAVEFSVSAGDEASLPGIAARSRSRDGRAQLTRSIIVADEQGVSGFHYLGSDPVDGLRRNWSRKGTKYAKARLGRNPSRSRGMRQAPRPTSDLQG